jgi:hypothetical protein
MIERHEVPGSAEKNSAASLSTYQNLPMKPRETVKAVTSSGPASLPFTIMPIVIIIQESLNDNFQKKMKT